ncbi:Hypothetical predicted protein [Cloeon dipterum]|nr:Hypothetical predicted protein [Cloeon dipterum]
MIKKGLAKTMFQQNVTSCKNCSTASKSSEGSSSGTFQSQGGASSCIMSRNEMESINISENDERGDTYIRQKVVANLGFFEFEKYRRVKRQNADNVCVLAIHYEFKNNPDYFRKGDACDVEYLKKIFGENRNCNFRNFQSPNKESLLQLLSDQEQLLQFFNSQDDVPSVFVLFVLSHGSENGTILTDHYEGGTTKYESFTPDEFFDSLQRLEIFDECLKVVNFGLCRGSLDDSKYDEKKTNDECENRNSCRITTRPGMDNYVVFYSTVETTLANNDESGSWLVRNICTCLNNANDEPLLKFFTMVQNQMHQTSRNFTTFGENTPLGQTPELKMFKQDRKFIISKARVTEPPISNNDGSVNICKVSNEILPCHFSWKSDEGQDIRGRRGFILSMVQNKQLQEMKRVLRNLDFEVTDWTLSSQSMEFYYTRVTELEPDVGCTITFIFSPVCLNEQKEVCVRVQQGQEIPITDILHRVVGPRNDGLIGKPKILCVVDVEAPQTDNISVHMKDLRFSATNHSGLLVLILKYGDALEKLIELFEKIGEKSLQELLVPLLTRECYREDVVLFNSTLQYLITFPILPRAFVKPEFKFKKTKIPLDQMVSYGNSTDSPSEEKINFDTLLKKAKRLFKENKKSFENPLQTVSHLEDPQISSDVQFMTQLKLVRDSAEARIVWLFNSPPGAGKSTVLKRMAHQLTKCDGEFKILQIALKEKYKIFRNIPAEKVDEIEFIAKTTSNSKDDITNWIERREVIVFFDGLDEVCPDFRAKIIQILIALNDARVPLFVGTRPHEVHHIQERIENTTTVEIEPFDEAKQIEFLKIVARKNLQEIEQLMKIFKDQDIMGNPLYLTMLAEYSGTGNLYDIYDTIVRRKVEICLVKENEGNNVGKKTIDKSLKFNQLVASRLLRGEKIDHGSVTKEELVEKSNVFGVVTYFNERLNFTHQTIAEFLTAQKFLNDLKNDRVDEEVALFNDEFVQCRKFVDLFFSTEMCKDASYAEAFIEWAKSLDSLKLVSHICRENLTQMFKLLNPDLSLKDEDGKNALHFALRHLEMVKVVHEKNSRLATETTKDGKNCLHLAIDDAECSEEVALWILQNTDVDKNHQSKFKNTLLLACERKKREVVQKLVFANAEVHKIILGGKSIMYHAIQSSKLDFVQRLHDRGSDINFRSENGKTALHIAALINKNPKVVKILLDYGAKINEKDNDKQTALHSAARYNLVSEVVQELLENGADVDSKDQRGFTALHLAAWYSENPEIVKILLQKGSKVNAKDNENQTALHYATKFNPDQKVVQILLENGADVNSKDLKGLTALHVAARFNVNPDIVKILLEKGAKVNAQDSKKWTALHYLVARFDPVSEVAQQLLEKGADVHSQGQEGITALHLAAKCNKNPEVIKILLENGANINAENRCKQTSLHFAAKNNQAQEVVEKLLKNGADVNSQDQEGSSALHLAARYNANPEIVKILLEKGIKVNTQDNKKWTALHYAARFNPIVELVQELLKNGADIHSRDQEGSSALHLAAGWNKNSEILKILLENGTQIESNSIQFIISQNNDNWTALHYAARFNPVAEVVQELLKNGAYVLLKNKKGNSALHLAAGYNANPKIIEMLLKKGAKVDTQNNEKKTALHLAARFNSKSEVVQKLLETGADVDLKDQKGNTVLHLAAEGNGNPEIVQILLDKGAKINEQDNEKHTALHLAARHNPAPEIIKKLLENGADVNAQTLNGSLALHLAAGWNTNGEILQILLDNCSNVNVKDNDKWTALHYAAKFNPSPEVVHKLLEKGDMINKKTNNGETALFLAAKHNPVKDVVKKLLDHGAKVDKMIRNDRDCAALMSQIKPPGKKFFDFFTPE